MKKKLSASTLKESIVIVVIACCIAVVVNLFHPRGFNLTAKTENLSGQIVNLSTEEVKNRYDLKSSVIVDSRNRVDFMKGHIINALNIPDQPVSLSMRLMAENMAALQGPHDLVIYCSGDTCGSSKNLARVFIEKGYSRHIYILKDGYDAWEKKQYPVVKGE